MLVSNHKITRECALKIALTRSIFQPKMHQISFGGREYASLALGGGGMDATGYKERNERITADLISDKSHASVAFVDKKN